MPEIVTIGIFLVAGFAFIVVFCPWLIAKTVTNRRKLRIYQQVAKRYGGNVVKRLLSRPKLWFRYGNSMGYLKSRRDSHCGEQSILFLTWPEKRTQFQIQTSDFGELSSPSGAKAKGFGLRDHFELSTKHEAALQALLSQGTIWKLDSLTDYLGTGSVQVRLFRGKLRIIKRGRIKTFQQLDDLVRLGLELHDQMLLTRMDGVDFLDDTEAKILDNVKCPICSECVVDEMVVCLRCKTPHCKDCWQYNGHCATFACDETRYYSSET